MTKRKVFYSFHYDNDCWRVQQIRNMGIVDGDEPVSCNKWEEIKRNGDNAIKTWINNSITSCSCLVVLIGSQTANRKWVQYEIKRAWETGKGVLGIRIHNLENQYKETCSAGLNPFDKFYFKNGFGGIHLLSDIIDCFEPAKYGTYNDIKNNIDILVEKAILLRERHQEIVYEL